MVNAVSLSETWLPRLLKVWIVFTLLTFCILLMHSSDDAVFVGRYSSLVFVQLVFLLILVGFITGLSRYFGSQPQQLANVYQQLARWRSKPLFAPIVMFASVCLLVSMWLFFLGNHLPTYAFLRMYYGASVIVFALALIYGGSSPQTVNWSIAPYLLIALLSLIVFVTLPYYPPLARTDEAFVFSMARNALETGETRPLIYLQAYPPNYYGGVWIWMMSSWLKLGGISLVSGRLYILLLSAISIGFLFAGTSRLYDRRTAWYVVLLGIYSFATLNHIRFDIHAAMWLSISVFFFSFSLTTDRWWAHIATGFTMGMSIDSNPIAYCFGVGLVAAYGWDYIHAVRRKRQWIYTPFLLMVIGGGMSLAVYMVTHSGGAFVAEQTIGDLISFYAGIVQNNLISGGYISQLHQYLYAYLTQQPILFGLMLLGIITAFREQTRADRFLHIMHFTWLGVIVFAYFYFPSYYLVLALPLYVLLAARGLAHGVPVLLGIVSNRPDRLTRATSVLLTIWLLGAFINGLRTLPSNSLEDVVETGRQISTIVPQDTIIVAAEPYYFGLLDHHHFIAGAVESAMVSYFGQTPESVWSQLQPDAIVFSEGWPTEPERSPALMAYMSENKFGLLACYETASFGHIELWSKDAPNNDGQTTPCTVICNPRTGC